MDCSFIGWCALKEESQAAWAQAILSFIGIATAIAIPWFQHRAEQKRLFERDLRQARSIALSIIPMVQTKSDQLDYVWEWMQRNPDWPSTLNAWDGFAANLTTPPEHRAMWPAVHLLEEAAAPVQDLIRLTEVAHGMAKHGQALLSEGKPIGNLDHELKLVVLGAFDARNKARESLDALFVGATVADSGQ